MVTIIPKKDVTVMINIYETDGGKLNRLMNFEDGCWVRITSDNDAEIEEVARFYDIDFNDMKAALDEEEKSRVVSEDNYAMVIVDIPASELQNDMKFYTTIPLGIILNKDVCVTLCNYETNMMIDFIAYQQKRGVGFTDSIDLVFRLFLSSSVWYLKRLKQINTLIEESKLNLDRKIDNDDLVGLSRLQDSLTYFATSIRGNEMLLSKLKFKLPVDELDADLIEDVNIEMSQAREMTNIYANILNSTMDTYASIISNNMSVVMKTLTAVSIILMLPTLIYSLYGVNLINGMEQYKFGFPLLVIASIVITAICVIVFHKKSWI